MPTNNAHEEAARAAKLLKLLAFVPTGSSREINQITAEWLAALSVPERAIFAWLAGCNAPSGETWDQLVQAVSARKTIDEVLELMSREAGR